MPPAPQPGAGIPWLLYLKRQGNSLVHFWPFDGWQIPAGCSAAPQVYPALWRHAYPAEGRTADQHDAFTVATWLSEADRSGLVVEVPGTEPDAIAAHGCRRRGLDPGRWVGQGETPRCRPGCAAVICSRSHRLEVVGQVDHVHGLHALEIARASGAVQDYPESRASVLRAQALAAANRAGIPDACAALLAPAMSPRGSAA